MAITKETAAKIAAEKSIAIIGESNIKDYCCWWGVENGAFHLGLGLSAEKVQVDLSKPPVVDERIPWEKVVEIFVDLESGQVSTQELNNVTIFDLSPDSTA